MLWAVVGSLLAPVLPGGWATIVAAAVLLLLPLVLLLRGFGGRAYPSPLTRVLVYRPFWYGQLFLPGLAAAGALGALVGLPLGLAGPLGRAALATAAALLAALALLGYVGARRLAVRPLDVAFEGLPSGLEGLRIAQLSDLHVGPHTPRGHLERVVAAVEDAGADLVVLTGDQVDDYAGDVEPLGRALGALAAPLGVIAIPGNHDVYAGWSEVRRGMERLGWTVLVNEARPFLRNGVRFWVAGTGDPAGLSPLGERGVAPDVARTLSSIPGGEFTIALAHNPALWPELARRGVALTLSGHTHHGQLSIPRLGWSLASVFLELSMGVYRRDGSVLYVNPGTNYWGIPFRVGALPEVTVVTLHRSGDRADAEPRVALGLAARPGGRR